LAKETFAMKRIWRISLVVTLLTVLLPFAAPAFSRTVSCPSAAPPKLSFGKPVWIDKSRAGGEPVSVVAQDGSIIVSAHAGTTHVYKDPTAAPGAGDFLVGYSNQTLNWRSTDDGETWKYVGTAGQSEGPHSPTSTGFSDPDLTMDAGGTIYNTEIDLANDSVYSSRDDGQSFTFANPEAASGDRPWLTGQNPGQVWLYVNSPKQLWESTDSGITFSLVSTSFPADGKLIVDPLNPKHGLIGPIGSGGAAISGDDAKTWKAYPTQLGKSTQFFGTVAVDQAGWIYSVAAGGYQGSTDTTPDGQVTFNYFNRTTKKWAKTPINIPMPKGDALWPWVIAGSDGRVAVVWYQTMGGNPNKFYIMAAETLNGHGSTVTCSDGSKKFIPPKFSVAQASAGPIHTGKICLQGTTCNADTDFQGGDRRLGDFFTVNFDHAGNIFIASGDTMLNNPVGGPKPVSNPIFIMQNSGSPLLTKPIANKKTPCLYPLPTC
jgi:hypothetical protein